MISVHSLRTTCEMLILWRSFGSAGEKKQTGIYLTEKAEWTKISNTPIVYCLDESPHPGVPGRSPVAA